MLVEWQAIVADGGPTLNRHWVMDARTQPFDIIILFVPFL